MVKVEARLDRSYFVRVGVVGGMFLFFGLIIASFGIKHHSLLAVAFAVVINLICAGLFWREYRLGPSVLDHDGVTRRDGARFSWTELIAIVDITHKTITSYTSIQFAGGEVRLFPLTLANAGEVVRFVERIRMKKQCSICTKLPHFCRAMQTHGREEQDTFLPLEAGKLKRIKDTEPGKTRSPELDQCPECGTYYLYEIEYEYLATGSEDEQKLTRLSDEEAAKYL
ncbi:MAG: hypothetical protein FJW32_03155 [Acidobacteria bacterium]|nr:hypothetical protein [Acidobacteriota bacterium]